MKVLGVSAWYHDSAACIVEGGTVIAAAQEERFTRKKHDEGFPVEAIRFCLRETNTKPEELTAVVFYDKPIIKFERILETYLAFAPRGFKSFRTSMPIWLTEKLFQKNNIRKELEQYISKDIDWNDKIKFSEHHLSHAASAFFPSPFEKAAILTLDGVGEWASTSINLGCANKITGLNEIRFPHSLGLLYSAFTQYTGFKVNSGEYKVMGLAPYGTPKYADLIKENVIKIEGDGSFRLNMAYFNFCTGLTMTNDKFHKLFGGEPRQGETQITQKEMDLAASVQQVIEEVVLKIAEFIAKETGENNLCLAGGVALNCVANGVLQRSKLFKNIWIQPASGDAGGAVGAALAAYYHIFNKPRKPSSSLDTMYGSYLGPSYSDLDTMKILESIGAKFDVLTTAQMIELTAQKLSEGNAIGWMQGKMEFGPRALGNRSIIADPRSPMMQKQLNLKVKYRESFRPFAPSVLAEEAAEWFDTEVPSPYMLLVTKILQQRQLKMSPKDQSLFGIDQLNIARSEVPAITHVDYSARLQTVHKETNPLFHRLISQFFNVTGCPMLVNTSFNVRGEPIVMTPTDAFKCFMGTELDFLVIGNIVLEKGRQDSSLNNDYQHQYELD